MPARMPALPGRQVCSFLWLIMTKHDAGRSGWRMGILAGMSLSMVRFGILPALFILIASVRTTVAASGAGDSTGNRLVYLDATDPFYVGLNFPKLTTPQWVGEPGVEAVVILAIDDMRDHTKYEAYLRPIIDRLKQIDGRAPVSIFSNTIDPDQPHLQKWLEEGLTLDVHTLTHPCPLLAKSNFVAAAETYHGCVDLLHRVPGNKPVAYRMPCCDSMNSPSPRFYAEMFNRTSPGGKFLTIDSSVMNITTPKDQSLPRHLVVEDQGIERFRKYLPFPSFVTTIEDYPYPYVIGGIGWEFPAMVPSDWEAQNRHGVNNPATVADWNAALDVAVLKQGLFTFIFHPHGWIRPEQMVEFIDYAVATYGKKVKFLNFREAEERINRHLLGGHPLRNSRGQDHGVRLLDVNNDGFLDVVIGFEEARKAGAAASSVSRLVRRNERVGITRVWDPIGRVWKTSRFPVPLTVADEQGNVVDGGVRFGVLRPDGVASFFVQRETSSIGGQARVAGGVWHYADKVWQQDESMSAGLNAAGRPVLTTLAGRDRGVRFRDLDRDGISELIVSNPDQQTILSFDAGEKRWKPLTYALPDGIALVDEHGRDNGVRFVDLNEDGFDDLVFSNPEAYAVHVFTPKAAVNLRWEVGWTQKIRSGKRSDPGAIPMIVRDGDHRNNGVWFHSRHMWVQNEDVAHLPDKVDRRSFEQLLAFDSPPPKSPHEAVQTIRVRPGFKVELVAHEPMVADPVAFDWSADGRLWVVEMIDYPVGIDETGKPGGKVRVLEDADGDGRYERSTVFLEGLNFPNGIMPWRGGVIISAAPEVFYAEDTDGDGKADVRRTLLEGFREGNQQHRVNGFDYGLDNWTYGANGDSGGIIHSVLTGKRFDIRGRDFRFKPDTGEFETIAGQTQFGRHRDDWGNWFGNNNPTWLWHYYLPEHYVARNPHLAVRETRRVLANYERSSRALAISPPMQRFNWPNLVNAVTSANSAMPYRDELFGPDFATSVFISEPAQNLIHREVLEADGVTFTSRRAPDEEETEFLASTDNWFRPAMIRTGPDGALYFADMYRLVIEHIEYALPGMEKQIDLRAGADMGRIYRIVPEGAELRRPVRLDRLSGAALAAALDSPNGWQRDTVQRLLVESNDASAKPTLVELARRSANPKVRLQALCTLEGLSRLDTELLARALEDSHPAVREHAIRLSEPRLASTDGAGAGAAALFGALAGLANDPNIRVRYQLAFSLGEWQDDRAGRALAKIAVRDGDDLAVRNAVLSSALPHVSTLLESLMEEESGTLPGALMEQLGGLAVNVGRTEPLVVLLNGIGGKDRGPDAGWQIAALSGVLSALERRNESIVELRNRAPEELRQAIDRIEPLFGRMRELARNGAVAEPDRIAAIGLIGRGLRGNQDEWDELMELLLPRESAAVQKAALENLSRSTDSATGDLLLKQWRSYGPAMRIDILNTVLSRNEWVGSLLAAVESGAIPAGQISATHQEKLLRHTQGTVRERAARLFDRRADRDEVIKEYEEALALNGDARRGAVVYREHCAVCHRFRGEGIQLGPDIESFSSKSPSDLLLAILAPNQAVDGPYLSFTAVTRSDRELTGMIVAESANSLTIRSAGGAEETILRNDLKELTSSGLSLMPEGFENLLTKTDLADLLRFLTTSGVQ